jgi:rubredoxin
MANRKEWECPECGLVFRGFYPPDECPACGEPLQDLLFDVDEFEDVEDDWLEDEPSGEAESEDPLDDDMLDVIGVYEEEEVEEVDEDA